MSYEAEREEVIHGGTLRIIADEDAQNPRTDYDPVGVFVCEHRRYNLGDRRMESDEEEALARGGFPLLKRYLRMSKGALVVLPLYLYDHSGLRMNCGGFSDPWDSGQVGFAYVTKADIELTGAPDPEALLRQEVETYDQYLSGDVWGYVLEDAHGEHVDSCWGFYGIECAQEAGREAVTSFADELAAKVGC